MMKSKANEVFINLRKKTTSIKEKVNDPNFRKKTYNKGSSIAIGILKYILLYGLAFIILFPLIQQLAVAFRAPEDINNPLVLWIPEKFSLQNFKIAFVVLDFWKSFFTTLIMSAGVTILQLIMASLVGYALARLKFPGNKIVFALVIVTIIVAPTTYEIPLRHSLSNLFGTKLSLIGKPVILFIFAFTGLGIKAGIFIYLFRQFFRGVPVEIEEAAMIDGANPLQIFTRVMLPNAAGAIILTSILTFVWQWNDTYYIGAYITRVNTSFNTLSTKIMGISSNISDAIKKAGIWELFGQDVTKNPLFLSMILNTSAMLTMIPLLIFYLLVQRKLFTEGVERSGLVG